MIFIFLEEEGVWERVTALHAVVGNVHCLSTGHLEKCEGAIPHFWAKITPNCTKSHYFSKIALL